METTTYKNIVSNKFNLAPSQLATLAIPNKNKYFISDLLSRKLKHSDNGNEVGSINYIPKSPKYFIRAKALQQESFLPVLTNETAIPIRPQVFTDFDLKEGDILISKDSNIGETVILDKDLPNYTISGALYKLPIKKNKYYLFAFLKHKYFLKQLDLLVPKGATIRHAKTLFLNCKIPFPTKKNKNNIIQYVEILVQAIINKEKEIKKKHKQILTKIEQELLENQKYKQFKCEESTFREIKNVGRLDAGLYCKKFKKLNFLFTNYKNGYFKLNENDYKAVRGPNLAVSVIGQTIYSSKKKEGFYNLVQPTDLSEFGTIENKRYFGNRQKLPLLKQGDIIFGAEGNIGKCLIICNELENTVTNYHGMSITNNENKLSKEKIFIGMFILFLRKKKFFDFYSVGGQGGSFGKEKTENLIIPNFPLQKQQEIASLYYNPINCPKNLNPQNFLAEDQKWNEQAGIIEVDKSIKKIKEYLDFVLDKIIDDEEVIISFDKFH